MVCDGKDIDTIHRLPSKNKVKTTIVRFCTRKTVRSIFENKHKLKDLSKINIDIDGLDRIYINPSFCVYFKSLHYNCRLLKRKDIIKSIYTDHEGTLKVKTLNDRYIKITHETDLERNFGQFKDFSF